VSSRVDEDKKNVPGEPKAPDAALSRRDLLRAALGAAVVLVLAGVAAVAKSLISPGVVTQTTESTSQVGTSTTTSSPFPKVKVANLSDLQTKAWISFNYPLEETPNILAKLGQKVQGGVGPNGDIVAFSQICQHLGCIIGYVPAGGSPSCDASYTASGPVGYCCCHGTAYDLTNGAKVIGGPAPRPVPQVTLEFDSSTGDIFATGMSPPTIFGHDTGSNDVLNDLQGGTPVDG
jgi:arsenite oxidase small subunit